MAAVTNSTRSTRMENARQKFYAHRWELVGQYFYQRVPKLPIISVGQVLLTIPLVVFLIGGIISIFVNPSTRQAGKYTFYSLIFTFLLSFKSTSIFRLLFGLSWTELVPLHRLAAVCCLVLAVGHSYVAYTGQDYIQPEECVPGYVAPSEEYAEDGERRSLAQGGGFDTAATTTRVITQHHRFAYLCLEENPKYRYSMIGPDPDWWAFIVDGGRHKSGFIMAVCLVGLLAMSSLRFFRRHAYELWLVLHISLAGAMMAYANKHRIGMRVWIIVCWWALDGLVRYVWGMFCVNPKKATLTKILPDVVQISFPREKFSFQAGQFVRIAFPKTKHAVMFHPLSLSSAPYEDTTALRCRVVGGWTTYLANLCPEVDDSNAQKLAQSNTDAPELEKRNSQPPSSVEVDILIEGPYGSLDVDLWSNHERYPTVVLICGGIGVTPILSIARQLLFEHTHQQKIRRKVLLVWALRDISLAQALMPLMARPQDLKKTQIQLAEESGDEIDDFAGKKHRDDAEAGCSADTMKRSSSASASSIFCGDIYVTTKSSDYQSSEVTCTDNEVTWKLCHEESFTVHSGLRPDVHSILASTSAGATAIAGDVEERLAVICCGPASLTRDAKAACVSLSRPGTVMLDFHEEIFLI